MDVRLVTIGFSVGVIAVCAVMTYRVNAIFTYWKRATMTLISDSKRLIDEGRYEEWPPLWDNFDKTYGTYGQQVLALNKWTFKQFYPDLEG